MIGNQKTNDDGYVTIATKVPPHIAELLNIICAARGIKVYELLNLCIQAIIETAKCTTDLSPDLRQIVDMLRMDAGWNNAFSFASPSAQTDVAQLILILQQPDRKGFGLTMIDRPFMGDARQTYCVDDILERVAEVSMRGLYKELRQIGIAFESQSLRETLTTLCDAALIDHLDKIDQSELPQIGIYTEFGKAIEYASKTKSKHHRTPDDQSAIQQCIVFDDDDKETARKEADDAI